VFLEESFQDLPLRREWDHAINLVEGAKAPRGQCYPLSHTELGVLKEFLKMNIEMGKIRLSNSPYASPFFFCPKLGTGELRGIQDY
jgi:hypothetical protein